MQLPASWEARFVQRMGSTGQPMACAASGVTGYPKHASFSLPVNQRLEAQCQCLPHPTRKVEILRLTAVHVTRFLGLSPRYINKSLSFFGSLRQRFLYFCMRWLTTFFSLVRSSDVKLPFLMPGALDSLSLDLWRGKQ